MEVVTQLPRNTLREILQQMLLFVGDKDAWESAENERNLNVKNMVSWFKNYLGRSFKDEYVQKEMKEIGIGRW